jgi:hypothetical protein
LIHPHFPNDAVIRQNWNTQLSLVLRVDKKIDAGAAISPADE